MTKGGALVRFHDWRTARDHKAATRHFWRCRCIGLVAVPVSIGLATPGAAGRHVTLLHPAAHRGAEVGGNATFPICPRVMQRIMHWSEF